MSGRVRQALLGAGANLGDRDLALKAAIEHLRTLAGVSSLVASPVYETDPVGLTDQPKFLNLVIGLETTLSPDELLATLQELEQRAGRTRDVRWGPRTLDLDLLAFEGESRATAELQLPHPRMLGRAFVTIPLRDVLSLPRFQRPCWSALAKQLELLPKQADGVRRVGLVFAMDEYASAVEYLVGLKQRGVQPGLERMIRLAGELGHPQQRVPCVHIAGTNGKGSVAAMLEAIFRSAGWKTGLYTSPHLVRLGERIQLNRTPLTAPQIAERVRTLRPIVDQLVREGVAPSYFEVMTAMAFTCFAQESCDIAVIETGMGGRLDATNIVSPEVSVITSIGIDHREFLGDTLARIATEKAGIIKPNRPVVIGRLPRDAEDVIRSIAMDRDAKVISVVEEFGSDLSSYPTTRLEGDHQRINAATATLAARAMAPKWQLTHDVITRGLQGVAWDGRWQRIKIGTADVILEAAHNAEGAEALERNLSRLAREIGRKPAVVVGVLGAERARALLPVVARHAAEIHLVVPRQSRACSFEELETLLPADARPRARRASIETLFPSPRTCTLSTTRPVVVTGSLYLVGEILARLDPGRGPIETHLQDF